MAYDRKALQAHARLSIEKGSKSFAFASTIFDAQTRDKVMLFYAWCRRCDDITDGQDHGHNHHNAANLEDRAHSRSRQYAREHIDDIRRLTSFAYAGENSGDPSFDALGLLLQDQPIDRKLIDDIIDGFALDADEWRLRSSDDLYQYCYHVAGAVGIVMAMIMGVKADDHDILDRACDLGIAFQLANIARDIGDDASNGRCYMPVDWLVAMDIEPGEIMRPHYRPALSQLTKRLCESSKRYNMSARVGAQALPPKSRWAIIAAANIYGDIARKVMDAGEQAWDHRQYVTKVQKLKFFISAFFESRRPAVFISRENLWTRARR